MSDQQKQSEKYNTVFLVSQIQSERSKNIKIGIAVGVVILLLAIYLLFIREPAPPEMPHRLAEPPAGGAPSAPH